MAEPEICPRCERSPVQYGAVSTTDGKTNICEMCVAEEGFVGFLITDKEKEIRRLQSKLHQEFWPIGVDRG